MIKIPMEILYIMSSYGTTEAESLRSKLIETYRDTSIEEYFKGEEFETNKGVCYKIEESRRLSLSTISKLKAKRFKTYKGYWRFKGGNFKVKWV
jgi:hypothetical protein